MSADGGSGSIGCAGRAARSRDQVVAARSRRVCSWGNLSARVRGEAWQIVTETMGTGRAIMVFRARNEQGMSFLTWGDPWVPADYEGLTLMVRPGPATDEPDDSPRQDGGRRRRGTSDFEKRRRARRGFPRSDRSS